MDLEVASLARASPWRLPAAVKRFDRYARARGAAAGAWDRRGLQPVPLPWRNASWGQVQRHAVPRSCSAVGSRARASQPSTVHMSNGDDREPHPRRGPISRRDRVLALLIALLIAVWLWLLHMIG